MSFTYNEALVEKRIYKVEVKCAEGAGLDWGTNDWVEIGILEENPELVSAIGDEVALHTGAEVVISENVEFSGVYNSVTPANYNALKSLINHNVDIMFTDEKNDVKITAEKVKLYPALQAIGNDMLKIEITAKKESTPGSGLVLESTL